MISNSSVARAVPSAAIALGMHTDAVMFSHMLSSILRVVCCEYRQHPLSFFSHALTWLYIYIQSSDH